MNADTLLDGRLLDNTRAALWSGVRLAVVDLETCAPPEGGRHRIVSVGVVTCRAGASRGRWSTLVDPECPIDPVTRSIHGITDELVAGEPTFDAVAPQIVALLEARHDERVVLVAHNVRSDVSVLRSEFDRVGLDLPTVEVLDTMGRLARIVEVRPASRSLAALADSLGLVNPRPHDALADAQTCADAAIKLLDRAAARGLDNFDQLLAEVSAGATTATIQTARRAGTGADVSAERDIDPEHVATHADVLSSRVREAGLARWAERVAECSTLRCPNLVDRVEQAGPAPRRLLPFLEGVLDQLAAAGDGPGAATLLPALLPLLPHLPPGKGRHGTREAVLAWARRHGPGLDALDRCNDDRCPSCEARQPCPLDTWRQPLAPLAVGDLDKRARSFLKPNGKEAGTGAYTTWLRRGLDHLLADEALAVVVQHWRDTGQHGWADTVAQYGWDAGCRHPDIAEAVAVVHAAPGRETDLRAAVTLIDAALSTAGGSTAPGWTRLEARRAHLAGLLRRATSGRPTGEFDADGNPIYAAPHHPTTPRRTRTPRFAEGRSDAAGGPALTVRSDAELDHDDADRSGKG